MLEPASSIIESKDKVKRNCMLKLNIFFVKQEVEHYTDEIPSDLTYI